MLKTKTLRCYVCPYCNPLSYLPSLEHLLTSHRAQFCQLSNTVLKNQSVCCGVSSDQVCCQAFRGAVNQWHSLAVPWPFSRQMTTVSHLAGYIFTAVTTNDALTVVE